MQEINDIGWIGGIAMCNVAATQRFFLDSNFNQSSPAMADAAKMLRTDTRFECSRTTALLKPNELS